MIPQTKKRIEQLNNGEIPNGYKKTGVGVFPDDWVVANLGDICDVYSGGTPNTGKSEYWNGDIPWCSPTDITKSDKYITKTEKSISKEGLNSSSAVLMPVNSILMCSRATIGPKCINKVPMTTNQGFKNLICKNPQDTEYIYYLLDSLISIFIKNSNGSTFLELSKSELEKSRCCIPPKEHERTRIAEILMTWDKAIELHKQQIEKLKQFKSVCLKKMFPAKGQTVPEWRFKGFTDAWEQRKVGELLTERNDQAPMSDEYPLMAFIANEGVSPKGERYDRSALVNDTAGKLYKKTEFGDFIYSSNNLETGSIGLNKYGKASISPVYSIFQSTGLSDSDFIGRRFVRKDFINAMVKWRQGVIYGQWRIHESDFIKIEVAVPSVEEQRKIGVFFDNLDNLITIHQRKVETYQKQYRILQQYLLNGIVRV